MGDLVNLKCENCGATLKRDLTCPYCGARYERKYQTITPMYVQTCPAKIDRLATSMSFDRYALKQIGEEAASDIAMEKMSMALAGQLAKYMKIETHYDPRMDAQIIQGEVRVAHPDFRF